MTNPQPRVVIPSTTRRDAFIAIIAGVAILALIGYAIIHMAQPVAGNRLTGVVVGKEFTPRNERQVSFSGRKIEETKEIDGEYVLKVRVDSENRTYEVPVEKALYEGKKEGDSLSFIRPPSEQH